MYCNLLPELNPLEKYNGNFQKYQNVLYNYFLTNIKTGLLFNGKNVSCRREPIYDGREDSFYHLTSKDFHDNNDREPDMRRCERLKWIKPGMMGDHKGRNCFRYYEKYVRNKRRVHLFDIEDRYMIILEGEILK